MKLFEVRHQPGRRCVKRTRLVTESLDRAKNAAKLSRCPSLFVWEDGNVTHIYDDEGTIQRITEKALAEIPPRPPQ